MKWRLFICADCDSNEGVLIHQVADAAPYDVSCNVEACPGCGGIQGLIGMGDVEVAGNALVHLSGRV